MPVNSKEITVKLANSLAENLRMVTVDSRASREDAEKVALEIAEKMGGIERDFECVGKKWRAIIAPTEDDNGDIVYLIAVIMTGEIVYSGKKKSLEELKAWWLQGVAERGHLKDYNAERPVDPAKLLDLGPGTEDIDW